MHTKFFVCSFQHVSKHCSTGSFTVTTRNGDRPFKRPAYFIQKLTAGNYRFIEISRFNQLSVVTADSVSVNYNVEITYTASAFADFNSYSQTGKLTGINTVYGVTAGDRFSVCNQKFCKRTHARSADSDEVKTLEFVPKCFLHNKFYDFFRFFSTNFDFFRKIL